MHNTIAHHLLTSAHSHTTWHAAGPDYQDTLLTHVQACGHTLLSLLILLTELFHS